LAAAFIRAAALLSLHTAEEGFQPLTAYEPLIEQCNIKEIIGYLAQT
jgi:hypothetical protein